MSARRRITGGAAVTAAAGLGLALVLPGTAAAEDAPYPAPTVEAHVDGSDIVTTVTDNGDGEYEGEDVHCAVVGMKAIDALTLAGKNMDEVATVLANEDIVQYGSEGSTRADDHGEKLESSANAALGGHQGGDELSPGVYVSTAGCVTEDDAGAIDGLVSYDWAGPLFVPGGPSMVPQAVNLGSQMLELDNLPAAIGSAARF